MGARAKKKSDFIVFGQPQLSNKEIAAVSEVLRSGWIGTGPRTREFETEFARYQGVRSAVGVSSCTAAISLALEAFGIGPGDEVITTAMTFAATIGAILDVGATPVLVDVEPESACLDVDAVERHINTRTRAIIPVHFAGAPANMDALLTLRQKHGLKLIHDCAHAIETQWNSKRLGSYADAACYSFYSTKNLTTIEGGMVCSDDQLFVERIRLLSNHGMSKDAWKRFSASGYQHYDIVSRGHKSNLTDVQSALGLCQLASLDKHLQSRREIWSTYEKALGSLPLTLPKLAPKPHSHAMHLYTVRTESMPRDQLLAALQQAGIGCGVHYRAISELTYFRKKLGLNPKDYPVATAIGQSTLSLPLTPYLTQAQIKRVVAAVQESLADASYSPLARRQRTA